ncbi:hypothetical protein FXO38_06010 [Capsicum annuum]|uniref:Uncharacterized protein n=1 Tax=Capsicum annuum TaxID=4072 RepID=A0A2G2YDM3_CAPAN|nr:hypothetical protein FXO38_06010 [Capsicum annuum]PHT67789.1 hypothetical protein T459_27276 [Capsicum annuum]
MRNKLSVGRSLKALLAVSFFMYFICFFVVDAVIDVVGGTGIVGTCGVVLLVGLALLELVTEQLMEQIKPPARLLCIPTDSISVASDSISDATDSTSDANYLGFMFMKLRLDRVLQESYEADSLEEALASDAWYLGVAKPSIVEMHGYGPSSNTKHSENFSAPGCYDIMQAKYEKMDFYNLELSNTNVVDHTTHYFNKKNGITFQLEDSYSFVIQNLIDYELCKCILLAVKPELCIVACSLCSFAHPILFRLGHYVSYRELQILQDLDLLMRHLLSVCVRYGSFTHQRSINLVV